MNQTRYAISVLLSKYDVTPQDLLRYERAGLLHPEIVNDVRFYAERDLERLGRIRRLTSILGINLAGVDVVLRLLDELEASAAAPGS